MLSTTESSNLFYLLQLIIGNANLHFSIAVIFNLYLIINDNSANQLQNKLSCICCKRKKILYDIIWALDRKLCRPISNYQICFTFFLGLNYIHQLHPLKQNLNFGRVHVWYFKRWNYRSQARSVYEYSSLAIYYEQKTKLYIWTFHLFA